MILEWQDFPQAARDKIIELAAEKMAEQEVLGRVYTPKELAERLNIHPKTALKILERGDITPVSTGESKGYRITEYEVRRYLKMIA